jgi:hypothetical protein
MAFGSAFHKMALEPDAFFDEYAIAPDCDKRTNAGKAQWAEFVDDNPDKLYIDETTADKLHLMCESIRNHPIAANAVTGGQAEQSLFWKHYNDDTDCKCRPDYIRDGYIVDIKTTEDARPDAFSRTCWNYRYHVQAAYYLDGYQMVTGNQFEFIFIAIEKKAPYAVAVYMANPAMVEQGRNEYLSDLAIYAECKAKNEWPAYPQDVQSIMLPRWAEE